MISRRTWERIEKFRLILIWCNFMNGVSPHISAAVMIIPFLYLLSFSDIQKATFPARKSFGYKEKLFFINCYLTVIRIYFDIFSAIFMLQSTFFIYYHAESKKRSISIIPMLRFFYLFAFAIIFFYKLLESIDYVF